MAAIVTISNSSPSALSSVIFLRRIIVISCFVGMAHVFLVSAKAILWSSSSTVNALLDSSISEGAVIVGTAETKRDGSGTFWNEYSHAEANVDDIANQKESINSSLRQRRRRLVAMPPTSQSDEQLLGDDVVDEGGVIINMMRRAKDHVSPSDVPLLLQIPPHDITSASEAVYNIMTQCYGLIGQRYDNDNVNDLQEAKRNNLVDKYFLSADYYFGGVSPPQQQKSAMVGAGAASEHTAERKLLQQQPFHFLATHHYQEGAALFTPKHRGRVIAILEHPVIVVQKNFVSSLSSTAFSLHMASSNQHQQHHDALLEQLIQYVNSTNYVDNTMTRMISNVPHPIPLTEEHFKYARMILENKFLIGMGYDMNETLYKRIKLYFGWKELSDKRGCEAEIMRSLPITNTNNNHKQNNNNNDATSSSSSVLVEEGSKIWRFIQRKNLYDMKLYARGMSIFADQKMRLPVHYSVRQQEVAEVQAAFFDGGNLRSVEEYRDASDIPFFW
jgi:hypothetical protein